MPGQTQDQRADAVPPETVAALEGVANDRIRTAFTFSAVVCLVFFPLPLLSQFTSVLDGLAFGGLTWAWLYAFLQFAVAVLVAAGYGARAAKLDAATAEALGQKG